MRKRASSILTVAAATALWLTLDQTTTSQERAVVSGNVDQTYLEHASHWRFDDAGVRRDTLEIERARRGTSNDETELEGIVFNGHDEQGELWSVTAHRGSWWDRAEQLRLRDEVVLTSLGRLSTLQTTDLAINLAREQAWTGSRIELTTPRSKTVGYGLSMDLNAGIVIIKRNVETQYVQ